MIYFKLVLTAIIWGGTFIAGRLISQEMSAFSAAFCRFAIASLCLLVLLRKEGFPSLKPAQWLSVIVLGLSGIFAYNVLFFLGLQSTSASRASLIVASNPVAIALFSALFLNEKLTPLKILGICTSVFGAAIVISQGKIIQLLQGGVQTGDLILLGCVASWVIYTLVGKRIMTSLSTLAATTYACLIGTAALMIPALFEGLLIKLPQITLTSWISILYLGILGSAIGFNWYYQGVREIGASKASIFINLVPPSAIVLAALILHEPITSALLVGGSLIITGVICTNRS